MPLNLPAPVTIADLPFKEAIIEILDYDVVLGREWWFSCLCDTWCVLKPVDNGATSRGLGALYT